MVESANIARHLGRKAAQQPDRPALKIPRGRNRLGAIDYLSLSFAELEGEVDAWVLRLRKYQVEPGDRVLIMVRQGLPLIAGAFALFKCGAIPIVIDPGMPLKSFLSCVHRSRPQVLLGIPLAQLISRVFLRSFRTLQQRIPVSRNPLARLTESASVQPAPPGKRPATDSIFRNSSDLAAILFTSGSTGLPKGVCYEHGMFEAQVRLIQTTYQIQPGEIDLPMLPIFALFNPALGMTTVVPEIDPSRPADLDPAKIVQAIQQENVTNSFGSPTLWNKIAEHCIRTGTTLPSLQRVLCAGAPVPISLWQHATRFLPNGQLHSPYGATEALPVSSVSAAEILGKLPAPNGKDQKTGAKVDASNVSSSGGTCVGHPVGEMAVKIIALVEGPIESLEDVRELARGEVGEIIVFGPVVTKHYDELPEATAACKIQAPTAAGQILAGTAAARDSFAPWHLTLGLSAAAPVWHRMGDCGFLDTAGRLWFCGRKVERVETSEGVIFTEPCELVFRSEPWITRCALVGLGERPRQIPALVIQPDNHSLSLPQKIVLVNRLRNQAKAFPASRMITRFYFHPKFPVDVRHNAKIHRLTLAKWAATQSPIEVA